MGKSVIFVFFLFLIGCSFPFIPDDEDPPVENQAPVASFADADYIVLGGGSSEMNGLYREKGTTGNVINGPKYEMVSDSYYAIYQYANSAYEAAWAIHSSIVDDSTDQVNVYYYIESPATYPPVSGWTAGIGLNPSPEIHQYPVHVECIGDYIVSVKYNFSDPDNDQEGSTVFEWYSSIDGSTGWTLEESGTSSSFTTTSDLGFIKVIITPVDSLGLEGSPIESSPIDMCES